MKFNAAGSCRAWRFPVRVALLAIMTAAPGVANAIPAGTAGAKAAPRTLDSILIEGDVAVPQVLFITARDVRRFRDGHGATYRKSATDVARSLSGPSCVRMTVPTGVLKEETP